MKNTEDYTVEDLRASIDHMKSELNDLMTNLEHMSFTLQAALSHTDDDITM